MLPLAMDDITRRWVEKVARTSYWDHVASYSDALFCVVFAFAALLMIAGCLLPRATQGPGWIARLSHARRTFMQLGAVMLLILLALTQQRQVDNRRGFVADQNKRYEAKIRTLAKDSSKDAVLQSEYLYVPQGNSLVYMSLGNTGIAADYMWLTSLQYVTSSFRRGQKFQMLTRFYDTMMELDPHWVEAQVNAGRVLSALEPDRYAVEKFYMRAIQNNPGSPQLFFEAGKLFIVPPNTQKLRKDYAARAAFWFGRAHEKYKAAAARTGNAKFTVEAKKAGVYMSQMALDSGQLETSDTVLWELATDKENPSALRYASAQDWLNARSLLVESLLGERTKAIKARTGSFPPDLGPVYESLRSDPRVAPIDAYGFRFAYNPATGEVRSQGVLVRRTIQSYAVIWALVEDFRGAVGRPPANMNEVQAFTRKKYAPPAEPATAAVTDWIGEELNVITTPLGGKWTLNEAGELQLPAGIELDMVPKALRRIFPDLWE